MNAYLVKSSKKFDVQHFESFGQQDAQSVYLKPIGLSLAGPIPASYGDNAAPFTDEDERLHFKAFHFIKYKMAMQMEWNRLSPNVESLFYAIRNRIISANMGLIFGCIKKFRAKLQPQVTQSQLLSEGHKAIIKSVDCFSPFLGYRFSTYACGAILRDFARLNNKPCHEGVVDPMLNLTSLANREVHKKEDEGALWIERLGFVLKTNKADLTPDEVSVINSRFTDGKTYTQIAHSMKSSKQYIVGLQKTAITKIKQALLADPVIA
jgi:DNA-directed RNA polymerase specialized sigma subunit